MRGHAQSGSRKLNRHWQSGGGSTPPHGYVYGFKAITDGQVISGNTTFQRNMLAGQSVEIQFQISASSWIEFNLPPVRAEIVFGDTQSVNTFNLTQPIVGALGSVTITRTYQRITVYPIGPFSTNFPTATYTGSGILYAPSLVIGTEITLIVTANRDTVATISATPSYAEGTFYVRWWQ